MHLAELAWSERFEAGTPLHILTSGTCLALIALLCMAGLRWRTRTPRRERALRIAWVGVVVPFQVFVQTWYLLPANFTVRWGLPIHICDLVVWAVPFAFFLQTRWIRTVLYFWGVGLSIQAFFMPALTHGPAEIVFWLFWIAHTHIVGSGLYVAVVLRYRPTLRDVGVAAMITAAYIAAVLPVNIWLDVDYGYVGPGRSPGDALGPWPGRVFVLYGLEVLAFLIVWTPWAIARRRRNRSESARACRDRT